MKLFGKADVCVVGVLERQMQFAAFERLRCLGIPGILDVSLVETDICHSCALSLERDGYSRASVASGTSGCDCR